MAVLKFENDNTTFTVKHRAVCENNNRHYKGSWRTDYDHAVKDANRHSDNNPLHEVWIETLQTQRMITKMSK
ncbi:hypothetical protein GCM10007962_01250 [Yeosuana aromativorans]|uniref:Uncharacterized protein n=1 Tax=Yeosuana aromativorans TaxID=288019 RepID=A0A8J3BFQ0_9FLAO|nr:hypothetical protein [Yeosuana aromativorans]GGK10914.1 hypothetical protein GCM10007962_01250 [Yeosuana aromativorans]